MFTSQRHNAIWNSLRTGKKTGLDLIYVGGMDWRKRISEMRKILIGSEYEIKSQTVEGKNYNEYWIEEL